MTWGEFLIVALGITALGLLLIGLVAITATEILDPEAGRQHDESHLFLIHEEDPDRAA